MQTIYSIGPGSELAFKLHCYVHCSHSSLERFDHCVHVLFKPIRFYLNVGVIDSCVSFGLISCLGWRNPENRTEYRVVLVCDVPKIVDLTACPLRGPKQ